MHYIKIYDFIDLFNNIEIRDFHRDITFKKTLHRLNLNEIIREKYFSALTKFTLYHNYIYNL